LWSNNDLPEKHFNFNYNIKSCWIIINFYKTQYAITESSYAIDRRIPEMNMFI